MTRSSRCPSSLAETGGSARTNKNAWALAGDDLCSAELIGSDSCERPERNGAPLYHNLAYKYRSLGKYSSVLIGISKAKGGVYWSCGPIGLLAMLTITEGYSVGNLFEADEIPQGNDAPSATRSYIECMIARRSPIPIRRERSGPQMRCFRMSFSALASRCISSSLVYYQDERAEEVQILCFETSVQRTIDD
ncbi:hypothetical protein BC628DRAFT_98796 [Trametes gibbosa]|nr:hypothetical protein BC628DRAFT_98796 [Trametes gibbosa]